MKKSMFLLIFAALTLSASSAMASKLYVELDASPPTGEIAWECDELATGKWHCFPISAQSSYDLSCDHISHGAGESHFRCLDLSKGDKSDWICTENKDNQGLLLFWECVEE